MKPYWPLGKLFDRVADFIIRRSERNPDDAGVETSNDIIRFRTSMWCSGKRTDFNGKEHKP